jgi:hypothetical protein
VYETSGSVAKNIGVKVEDVVFRNITGTVVGNGKGGGGGAKGDPTFLVNAAGTFFGLPKRKCEFTLDGVKVKHANNSIVTPPAWACKDAEITVGGGGKLLPPLPPTCPTMSTLVATKK